MTHEQVPERRPTATGCLLLLVTVVVTLGICVAVGGQLFSRAVSALPAEKRAGVEVPREDFLGLPGVKLVLGFLVFIPLIVPGLAVWWIGEKVLGAIGLPVWRTSEERGRSPDGHDESW